MPRIFSCSLAGRVFVMVIGLGRSPHDGRQALVYEPIVDLHEVSATHKRGWSAMRRQGRGVVGTPNAVPWVVQKPLHFLRICAPQCNRYRSVLGVDRLQHTATQRLPAPASVAAGFAMFDRENGVEHQDTLLSPWLELAIGDAGATTIARDFLQNVSQGWGSFLTWAHRKRQAIRLAWLVVRVLPQYDDSNLRQRGELQRAQWSGWVDDLG